MQKRGFKTPDSGQARKIPLAEKIKTVPLLVDDLVYRGLDRASSSIERGFGVKRSVIAQGILWPGTLDAAAKISSDAQNPMRWVQCGIIGAFAALVSFAIQVNEREKAEIRAGGQLVQTRLEEVSQAFRKAFLGFAALGLAWGPEGIGEHGIMQYCAEVSAVFYLMSNTGNGLVEKIKNWYLDALKKARNLCKQENPVPAPCSPEA